MMDWLMWKYKLLQETKIICHFLKREIVEVELNYIMKMLDVVVVYHLNEAQSTVYMCFIHLVCL